MTTTTVVVIGVTAVIVGVIVCLRMILKFFWKVYDRGGPTHVGTVATALREVYDPEWPTQALRYLPGVIKGAGGAGKDNEDGSGKDAMKTAQSRSSGEGLP